MAIEEVAIDEGIASGSTPTDSYRLFEEVRLPTYRKQFSISNVSTGGEMVWATTSPTGPAVAGKGRPIYPGGTFGQTTDSQSKPWQGRIYIICSANTAAIAYSQTILREV